MSAHFAFHNAIWLLSEVDLNFLRLSAQIFNAVYEEYFNRPSYIDYIYYPIKSFSSCSDL